MSGRAFGRRDRAKACWHDEDTNRGIVTAARREQLRQMAIDDQSEFVRCLKLCRFVSLAQLPWWLEFRSSYPYEAAQIILMAQDEEIGSK